MNKEIGSVRVVQASLLAQQAEADAIELQGT